MGRSPCCEKVGLKKGPWTPEEDQKLLAYIEEHGHGSWRALPSKAGLQRCGKSCRLRWTNYLRPDIKRGKFSLQEEQTIIQLHALLGNRWSAIATHLPKRTDNEIKNYWNTHLKKRLTKMGIDPVTHKPKNDTLLASDGQSKSAANLSHMAQWESARLEAEARLVRESKLRSQFSTSVAATAAAPTSLNELTSLTATVSQSSRSIDVLRTWNSNSLTNVWSSRSSHDHHQTVGGGLSFGVGGDLESPTSTLSFSENASAPRIITSFSGSGHGHGCGGADGDSPITNTIEFVGINSGNSSETEVFKDGCFNDSSLSFCSSFHDSGAMAVDGSAWTSETLRDSSSLHGDGHIGNVVGEGFTNLLLNETKIKVLSDSAKVVRDTSNGTCSGGTEGYYEDNRNYWSSILHLVNSSPSESPVF